MVTKGSKRRISWGNTLRNGQIRRPDDMRTYQIDLEYLEKYLAMIESCTSVEDKLAIIDRVYCDGFEDGAEDEQ